MMQTQTELNEIPPTKTVQEYEDIIDGFDLGLDRDSDEFKTAVILFASAFRGTHTDAMAKWSGYNRDFVRSVARRLRDNGIWQGRHVHVNWVGNHEEGPFEFLLDLQVALGQLGRKDLPEAYSLEELKTLHEDINEYRRTSPGRYGVWSQKRRLTPEEWNRIDATIKKHRLAVVMRTSAFCFNLGVDIIKPPEYPGIPPIPLMAVAQKSVPEELAYKDKFKQGDKEWNPRDEWNATWDLFSKWTFTEENKALVAFCGIKMPTHKTAYEY